MSLESVAGSVLFLTWSVKQAETNCATASLVGHSLCFGFPVCVDLHLERAVRSLLGYVTELMLSPLDEGGKEFGCVLVLFASVPRLKFSSGLS